ncbi:sensor domain-containing diguanylate cyclase [Vibrio paucivorans]|uniref:Diguanylate cyclase n=1 Tax=Vibrio paucivorans TaxID=2829489 RepID=A0A9X3CHM4_9VIBR|nr:diguanylate cyclase [Vibrio paucivorans]MCW8335534.1 diguanylate cyclase [Vibrio paucivorans]
MNRRIPRFIAQFALVFIALSVVPTIYFTTELNKVDSIAKDKVSSQTQAQIEFTLNALKSTTNNIRRSIGILARNGLLYNTITKPNNYNIEALQDLWILTAKTQGYYSLLKLVDAQGNEIVRINQRGSSIEIVAKDHLNNDSQQDYFQKAQLLAPKTVEAYSSSNDRTESSGFTSLAERVTSPIDIGGERLGYFVADINVDAIFKALTYAGTATNRPDMLDASGYYIRSNNPDIQNSSDTDIHLSDINPAVWKYVQNADSGAIYNAGNWWAFQKLKLPVNTITEKLILLIVVPESYIDALKSDEITDLAILASTTYLLIFFLSVVFMAWHINHEKNSIESQIARAAMNGMSAVVITDKNNRIVQVNQEFTRLSGYTLEQVKGKLPSLFASGKHRQEFYMNMWKTLTSEGMWEGEVTNKRKDGSYITEILRIQTVTDRNGNIQFYVASFVDITHRKELENRLRELSERDALSKLWNRRKFDMELKNECRLVDRYPDSNHSCLAVLDIDHFKRINDALGHDEGDRVIQSVAKSLLGEIRDTDFLARIGGEEYALIMPHTDLDEAEIVLNRLRTSVYLAHNEQVSISGGVTDIKSSVQESYKRADVALYQSKTSGRNCISTFSSAQINEIA